MDKYENQVGNCTGCRRAMRGPCKKSHFCLERDELERIVAERRRLAQVERRVIERVREVLDEPTMWSDWCTESCGRSRLLCRRSKFPEWQHWQCEQPLADIVALLDVLRATILRWKTRRLARMARTDTRTDTVTHTQTCAHTDTDTDT